MVHNGPYLEESEKRISSLRNFYLNLPIEDKKNTIVSSHNGVIFCEMFDNYCGYLSLEEGGFYVISNNNEKLILEHEFHNYNDFNRIFYER